MDAGRLKVKSPHRHTDCTPLTGVTWSAHISDMLCFTFNCHTLHKPPQEVRREKLSAAKLPNALQLFSWQKHIIKRSWLKY